MARKKKKASAEIDQSAVPLIVCFAIDDVVFGDEGEEVTLTKGQRLELSQDDFEVYEGHNAVERGVLAKMKTAISGVTYDLKAGREVWLRPDVYEAWKAAKICEATANDPSILTTLSERSQAVLDAVAQRDEAKTECDKLQAKIDQLNLDHTAEIDRMKLDASAISAQIEVVAVGVSGAIEAEIELPELITVEFGKLVEMLPEDEPSDTPELALAD